MIADKKLWYATFGAFVFAIIFMVVNVIILFILLMVLKFSDGDRVEIVVHKSTKNNTILVAENKPSEVQETEVITIEKKEVIDEKIKE